MSIAGTEGSVSLHTPLDREIAKRAAGQHDLITQAQLIGAGLGVRGIAKRVERGALHRRHRNIYSLGAAPLSRDAAFHAAVLGGGDGSVLSSWSLAELRGLTTRARSQIAILSPHRRTLAGVRVHRFRSLDPRDVTSECGIPVTTVHRMFVDLADVLTPVELTAVIREAAYRGRFVEPAVRDAMARALGRRNAAVLEAAMDLYRAGSAGTRSGAEVVFARVAAGEPVINTKVLGIELDALWPDLRLNVEIDGPHHFTPPGRRADAQRDRILGAAGYTVLRFTDDAVRERPREVVAAIDAWITDRRVMDAA